jgi:uncharacterized protein (UPF0210 family)
MAVTVWSATESKVMVDSAEIEGLQSIEYKVSRSRTDIIAVGKEVRQGVEYGVKIINGRLSVKSCCPPLDKKLSEKEMKDASFKLQAQLKKGDHSMTVDFQECYLDDRDFTLDVNGVGIAIYTFTATDILEKLS